MSGSPKQMVDELGSVDYFTREKAEKSLTEWAQKNGKSGVSDLRVLLKASRSPEVRSRLARVISTVVIYEAVPNTKGYMGVRMMPLQGAVLLTEVLEGTPAAKSGLEINDKVIKVDGVELSGMNKEMSSAMDFLDAYVKGKKAGEKLVLTVIRGDELLTKKLKLGDYNQSARMRRAFVPFKREKRVLNGRDVPPEVQELMDQQLEMLQRELGQKKGLKLNLLEEKK